MIENKKHYPAICFTKLPNSAINHSIRVSRFIHTFAAMALQNGVDVKTVSSMLDHYSTGFTLDRPNYLNLPAKKTNYLLNIVIPLKEKS